MALDLTPAPILSKEDKAPTKDIVVSCDPAVLEANCLRNETGEAVNPDGDLCGDLRYANEALALYTKSGEDEDLVKPEDASRFTLVPLEEGSLEWKRAHKLAGQPCEKGKLLIGRKVLPKLIDGNGNGLKGEAVEEAYADALDALEPEEYAAVQRQYEHLARLNRAICQVCVRAFQVNAKEGAKVYEAKKEGGIFLFPVEVLDAIHRNNKQVLPELVEIIERLSSGGMADPKASSNTPTGPARRVGKRKAKKSPRGKAGPAPTASETQNSGGSEAGAEGSSSPAS